LLRLNLSSGNSIASPPCVIPPMVVLVEQDTIVCRCLQVCESDLLGALDRCQVRNLQDVARETGAGSGCMSCHRMIRRYLAQASSAGCMGSSACLGAE